jgi:hypothetical protein
MVLHIVHDTPEKDTSDAFFTDTGKPIQKETTSTVKPILNQAADLPGSLTRFAKALVQQTIEEKAWRNLPTPQETAGLIKGYVKDLLTIKPWRYTPQQAPTLVPSTTVSTITIPQQAPLTFVNTIIVPPQEPEQILQAAVPGEPMPIFEKSAEKDSQTPPFLRLLDR